MVKTYSILLLLLLTTAMSGCEGGGEAVAPIGGSPPIEAQALFSEHCSSCHNATDANIALSTSPADLSVAIEQSMPPGNAGACVGDCAHALAAYILQVNPGSGTPGGTPPEATNEALVKSVVMHRLNRNEYNNTVRDLFSTSLRPADDFPEDDFGYGFNNIASVLSTSLLHAEQYLAAAEALALEAITRRRQGFTEVIECDPDQGAACARDFAGAFGRKLWRRPLSQIELEALLSAYASEASVDDGLQKLIMLMLMSPNFIFRPEPAAATGSAQSEWLQPYPLASRLSYFLWSSTPDERLLDLAGSGALVETGTLLNEVERMLADTRSQALIEHFAVQWLGFDEVSRVQPSADLYPAFTPAVRESMRTETRLYLTDWLANDGSLAELLGARHTFLDPTLARFYDVPGPDFGWQKIAWARDGRRGLLAQGSLLTATSHPAKTSPVRRGHWVLDKLLCQSPPPPPPGVENFAGATDDSLSTRELFELHRQTGSSCHTCHQLMDPIGFGLENFDPVGRWRETANGQFIDATGHLPGHGDFFGPASLVELLLTSERIPACFASHLLTYALGEGIEAYAGASRHGDDWPLVANIVESARANDLRASAFIKAVVASPTFRKRLSPTE